MLKQSVTEEGHLDCIGGQGRQPGLGGVKGSGRMMEKVWRDVPAENAGQYITNIASMTPDEMNLALQHCSEGLSATG